MASAGGPDAQMAALQGRGDECAALEALLGAARAGQSGALVIRGEPGSGKTALLEWVAANAGEMTVLGVGGVQSESEMPFSGLESLLRPVMALREMLPESQSAALAGSLAIGPPAPGAPFAAYVATLALLAAAAETRALLVTVDDGHWLDNASLEALVFAARRMRAEGIAMVFALRSGRPTALDTAGLLTLTLEGLDVEAASDLLARTAGVPVAPSVARHLHVNTAGNPLALLELSGLLSHDQLAGREALADPLPAADAIKERFLGRSAQLPAVTWTALVVCAASESGDAAEVDAALGSMGIPSAALEAAETAGLIAATSSGWDFAHPLMRSAVYQGASGPERRAAHMALAHALSTEDLPDRYAWHLASGTVQPDEQTAAALESSALRARDRGGHVAAAEAFLRSARLSPDREQRARRLLEAATAFELGGRAGSINPLLDEALATAQDAHLRAAIQMVRGRILVFTGRTEAAHRLLTEEARSIEAQDPAMATSMLCSAGVSCFMSGNLSRAVEVSREALALGRRAGGAPEVMGSVLLGEALLLRGDRVEAETLLAHTLPIFQAPQLDLANLAGTLVAGQCWIWSEQYDRARPVLDDTIRLARAQGAVAALPFTLTCLAELDFRTGRWTAAYAGATEAVELAEQTGQESILPYSLICLARVEATRDHEEECRSHIDRALALIERMNTDSLRVYVGSVLGLLELGSGRPEAAIAALERAQAIARSHGLGEPAVVQWCPDLIEAYIHAGLTEQARELLGAFEQQASHTKGKWAAATAGRCRGMLADDDHFEAEFQDAVRLHSRLVSPFELARTQLCLGERRRRAGTRIAAREALRCATDTFEALDAEAWTQRARHEHNATGATPRRRDGLREDRLTAQELRVAMTVGNGSTTREAASQLFLSPKTIEFHLGNIYRKLEIRSRTELARHPALGEWS